MMVPMGGLTWPIVVTLPTGTVSFPSQTAMAMEFFLLWLVTITEAVA